MLFFDIYKLLLITLKKYEYNLNTYKNNKHDVVLNNIYLFNTLNNRLEPIFF